MLTLPGGFFLPIALETVTLCEYTVTQKALTSEEAEELLRSRAESAVQTELVAGMIRSTSMITEQADGVFQGRADLNCNELISRTVPVLLFGEDETNGKNHKRGAD